MDAPPLAGRVAALSLGALPVSYALSLLSQLSHPLGVALMSALVVALLLLAAYSLSRGEAYGDPLYAVFAVLAFTSAVDLLIALEEDGYLRGVMDFYTREGDPYLRTAHGVSICYWDGCVHYLLYLAMAGAIRRRRNYRRLGLYWLGSFLMSVLVFLAGNVLGKYGAELRPALLLAVPCLLLPCWAGLRLLRMRPAAPVGGPLEVQAEQSRSLPRRPLDLALVLWLLLSGAFALFRGLVVLDCAADACFSYIYQYEPALRDPAAYPRVQMLVQLFYLLPFYGLAVYALVVPGCSWLPDGALLCAGALGQAQFSHLAASRHLRTPFTYRAPDDTWAWVLLLNLLHALAPHLLALRCLYAPHFFLSANLWGAQDPPDLPAHKKQL